MVTDEGMEHLIEFARKKATSLAGDIYTGMIDDSPYERGAMNACQNCDYASICTFDPKRKPRRRLSAKHSMICSETQGGFDG